VGPVFSLFRVTAVVGGLGRAPQVEGVHLSFFNCKFDSVNLRASSLQDVAFMDCSLRDVDFGGAKLIGVTFPGSTLDGVRFGQARPKKVDLRGAVPWGSPTGSTH
jgi:Uncharacterized low-complexity proteins